MLAVNIKSDGTLLHSSAIFTIDEIHIALKESGFILIPEFVRGYSLESNKVLKKIETWIKFEPFDDIRFSIASDKYDDDWVDSIMQKDKEYLIMKMNASYGGPAYITTRENIKKFLDYLVLSGRYDIIFFLNDSLKNI